MRLSIKFKFLAGFTIIFLLAFLFLNYFVSDKIEANNEKTISEELMTISDNCNAFVRQVFVINQYNNDKNYFERNAEEIADELSAVIGSDVGIYSLNGTLIYSSNRENFVDLVFRDINNAVNGEYSYTINNQGDNVEVYFSYPVVIAGNKVGILRIIRNYSSLFQQGRDVTNFVFYITIIIFAVVFLFTFLLTRNLTVPLTKLARYTNEIAKGNLNVNISSKRKDEIGDVYSNFRIMVERISRQIKTIEKDRDDLKLLDNHRRHFYDNVTHELKTPLTTIAGYAQMIRENGFCDREFFEKGTGHIIDESKRLNTMVLDLLELSKQSSDIEEEFEKIDIGRLLQGTCEGMSFKAERYGNSIVCESKENIFINGDANKIKQVLINIIDNAIKYGFSNTKIITEAHADKDFVILNVKNRGCGIAEEDIKSVFIPFYRIDKQRSREMGSCGLGLSISKAIVEKHGGEINIKSKLNEETTVSIKLPIYKSVLKADNYEK